VRSIRLFLAVLVGSAAVAVIGASPAAAVPATPTIAQVVTSAGTFVVSPAAGSGTQPQVQVTGVTSGNTVVLYVDGSPGGSCVAAATTVTFNGATSGCAAGAPAPFTLSSGDASYAFTADQTAIGSGTSLKSATFTYILDTKKPAAPTGLAASQLPDDAIRLTWAKALEDTSSGPGSGVKTYHVFRSQADAPDPGGSYTDIGTLADTACSGVGALACVYDDIPASAGADPQDQKRYFYKVGAVDAAANASDRSNPSPATAPGIRAVVVPTPKITSVGSSTANPTYKPDLTAVKPDVVVAVGRGSGTLSLYDGATVIATKTVPVSAIAVTIQTADYGTGKSMAPRANVLTAVQTVGTDVSPPSAAFTYVLPPSTPRIDSVGTRTTSPAKAAFAQPDVKVSWDSAATNDTVTVLADDDCGGPHLPAEVGHKAAVSGLTTTFIGAAGDWGANQLAKGATYCLTARLQDTSIADEATALSAPSVPFQFERAPIASGYLLDTQGGLTSVNGATFAKGAPHFGFAIARKVVMAPDNLGGYILDGYGGLHPWTVGNAAPPAAITGGPYWSGWDIARDVVMTGVGKGYVLDGFGGIHAFGGAATASGGPYFGFDIARQVVVVAGGTGGYVLDGYGGIHPFSIGAGPRPPAMSGGPYFGFDIARDLVLASATGAYLLDGYGGVHRVGSAPYAPTSHYTSGSDLHRALVMTETDNNGGYLLDTAGRVSTWGDSVAIPRPATLSLPAGCDLVLTTR
jgi:hypothetical protein